MRYKTNNLDSRKELEHPSVSSHIDFLKEKFYQVETKWPQFKVLFEELSDLAQVIPSGKKVLILERAYFYGGWTLFAPIFHKQNVISIDCFIDNKDNRWGEQQSWLEDDRCIKWRPDFANEISNLVDIESGSIDYVIVPNVVHHEKNQDKMFQEFSRVLKKDGKCMVFEGLVRELHHMPDDYVRYTHEGIRVMFEKNGLKFDSYKFGSGVFDVIAYVWQNAFEYLPKDLRKEKMKWFYDEHFPYLQSMDQKYRKNLVKSDKAFPMSYITWAHKE